MVRDTEDMSSQLFHSKEGVTQGYPLSRIAYGIVVLPLIRELRDAHPCVKQEIKLLTIVLSIYEYSVRDFPGRT